MEFVLRILFSGLMVFTPSDDGKEVTVTLLNVGGHRYHHSDGTALDEHNPLLIARAGNCTGQCPKRDENIAQFLYADKSLEVAQDSLNTAVAGGGAWTLAGSDITVRKGSSSAAALPPLTLRTDARSLVNGVPQAVPTTAAEREDISWIADMRQLCPDCTRNREVLSSAPPGIVAARFRIRNGKVFTYSIARIGSNVTPVHFRRLDGQGNASTYSQAIASWVGVDIAVSGDSIEVVETKFAGDAGRVMRLEPDEKKRIEIAVLNLPPFIPPASPVQTPEAGKHFEAYYELMAAPPARESRLVPKVGTASGGATYGDVSWQSIHPTDLLWSDLLNQLRMNIGRAVYETSLCPPIYP
jgi:hypothetical protein